MQIKSLFNISLIAILFLTSCGETTNTTVENQQENDSTTTTTDEPEVKEPTAADKIAAANALMQKIDAGEGEQNVEKKRFMNNAMNMAHDQSIYTVYSEGDKMVKLTELMGESMYLSETTYYFQDEKIALIHTIYSFDDRQYQEDKVYFENGKPFAAASRSMAEDDEETDFSTLEMEQKEVTEVVQDMDAYMKALSEMPERLAASTTEG